MSSDLLLMASSGLPRNGLVLLADPYRDGYDLTPAERLALQTVTDYSGTGHGGTKGADANVGADDPFQLATGWAGNGSQNIAIPYQAGDKWSLEFVYTPHYAFWNYEGVFDHTDVDKWECWIDASGYLKFRTSTEAGYPAYKLPDDATFHAVVTVDGVGEAAPLVTLYVNGLYRASKQTTTKVACPGNLWLFTSHASNTKGKGVFHYARTYNRALGANEVARNYYKIKSLMAPRGVFVNVLERYKTRTTQALTNCGQGVVRGDGCWYGIGTDSLQKYDNNWTLLATNTQPHTDIDQSTNHLGAGFYYDGKLYVPAEEFTNDPYDNQWITVWDADTLELISKHDISAQATEIAGLCVCPNDGTNGVIYAVSYVTNNTILKYDLSDFSYLGAITLSAEVQNKQGIVCVGDYFYCPAGQCIMYRIRKDGDVLGRVVYYATGTAGEATIAEMEGPTWDERTGELVVTMMHDDFVFHAHWMEKY